MYTLKSIAKRGSILGIAALVAVTTMLPAGTAFADALNPLTERSLMLSSSAPGFKDTDGSGNSTAAPNAIGENYAPAGSGPNGKKTGETFSFTISSNADIEGFSLQYCTTAAGNCQSPGDNGNMVPGYDPQVPTTAGDFRDGVYDAATNVTGRPTNAQAHPQEFSDLDFVGAFTQAGSGAAPTGGQFQIYVDNVATTSTGWAFTKANLESSAHSGSLTGKNNYVTLSNTTTPLALENGDDVRIVFQASETVHITNPGSGSFFVKINSYSDGSSMRGSHNDPTPLDDTDHTVVDGGVTVANVMTDSIHITTKVLETMSFSVGTRNRDTATLTGGNVHGTCDPIEVINSNRLNLGNPDAEYSLETTKAWDVFSYWRLSSNSSGGATVYYSGNTLANTVGDEIAEVATESVSTPGTEQFGLGFVDAGLDTFSTAFNSLVSAPQSRHKNPRSYPFQTLSTQTIGSTAGVDDYPTGQSLQTGYDEATGDINDTDGNGPLAPTAKFRFLKSSLTVPEPIAQQDQEVISCATAKMRYVGNIAADTPAGVYTTKINYLAAPQY